MHDLSEYQIEIKGQIDERSFNATSPLQITAVETDSSGTKFIIFSDQSGLIGVIRHLHLQGYLLKAVLRRSG